MNITFTAIYDCAVTEKTLTKISELPLSEKFIIRSIHDIERDKTGISGKVDLFRLALILGNLQSIMKPTLESLSVRMLSPKGNFLPKSKLVNAGFREIHSVEGTTFVYDHPEFMVRIDLLNDQHEYVWKFDIISLQGASIPGHHAGLIISNIASQIYASMVLSAQGVI